MSYKNLEQQQAALAAAKLENSKRSTRIYVYKKWPNVVPCEATDKRISDIIDRWTGNNPDVLHTPQLFEEAIAENPSEFESLAQQPESVTRRQLTDSIIELLRVKGKGHDEWSLNQERTRLKTFTVEGLRARLADLQRAAHLAGQSVQTLKQIVVDARPNTGLPALPRQLFENGQTVIVNATYIRKLDTFSLKRMCRLYSTEAVNQRLAED